MTKFNNARDLTTGKLVFTKDLDKLAPGSEELANLGCPECGCAVTFYHSGTRPACFRTKRKVQHAEGCPNTVHHKPVNIVYTSDSETVYLSPQAQKRRSYAFYYRLKKRYDEEEGIPQVTPKKRKKPQTSPKKDDDVAPVLRPRDIHPTLHAEKSSLPEDVLVGNVRTPAKTPTTFDTQRDNGTYIFGGLLSNILIGQRQVTLILNENGHSFSLILDEALFATSYEGFKNDLTDIRNHVKGTRCIVTAAGETIPGIHGGKDCMVRNEGSLEFNGKSARLFLVHLNKSD